MENERIYPGDAERGEAQILDEHEVWCNEVARLLVGRVRFPAVKKGRHVEKEQFRLDHATTQDDGVIAVPILPDDRILLVRQFRHPVRMWLRELPRGGREKGERPEETAARELREEVGCEVQRTWPLGRVTTDSGQQTGYPHLVAARVSEPAEREPEDTEAIDRLFRYRFSELLEECRRGRIVDSFTLSAVLRLEAHFDGDRFAYREEYAPA